MAEDEIQAIVKRFQMVHHPESGYFKEIWREERKVVFTEKTTHEDGQRDAGSSIYTLLCSPNFISWHRLKSDEIYYWHAGGTLKVHLINKDGEHTETLLGDGVRNPGCCFQVVIPHDTWYAAEIMDDAKYVLFSAVVFPGWELRDWQEGKRENLCTEFPAHKDLFVRLIK